jgi:hypothetical protein
MKRSDRPGIPLDAIFCADGAPFPVLFPAAPASSTTRSNNVQYID